MKGKQADVLGECLRRILDQGESLEQCLKSYPEQADELRPLLKTALLTKQATAYEARPVFKAQLKATFRPARTVVRPAAAPRWRFQWAALSLGIALFLVLGGGTIAAAQSSMPESPLYGVKLASEQVQLALTPSQEDKALLNARFVDRRLAELDHVLGEKDKNKNSDKNVDHVVQNLNRNLDGIGSLSRAVPGQGVLPAQPATGANTNTSGQASKNKEVEDSIKEYARKHNEELQRLASEAPAKDKGAVQKALEHSTSSYNKALKAMGEKGKD